MLHRQEGNEMKQMGQEKDRIVATRRDAHPLEEEGEGSGHQSTDDSETASLDRAGTVRRVRLGSRRSTLRSVLRVGVARRENRDVRGSELQDDRSTDDALVVERRAGREEEVGLRGPGEVLRRDRAGVVRPLGEGRVETPV